MENNDIDPELARQREARVWQVAYYSVILGIVLGFALIGYTIQYGP